MSYVTSVGPRMRRLGRGRPARSVPMLGVFVAIGVLTAAAAFVAAFGAALHWWPTTPRVAWSPPVLLVASIRSVVYVAVAVAEWLVWVRRRTVPVHGALWLFVAQQVLATVWPVVFFAGYAALGLADLGVTTTILLVLDLLIAATVAAFWSVSRTAGAIMAVDLLLTLFVTALIIGSLGQHAL